MTKTNKFKRFFKGFKKIWEEKEKEKIDGLTNVMIEKLFESQDEIDNKKIKVEDYVGYLDGASVMMIIPKNSLLKSLIENNFDVELFHNYEDMKEMINPSCYIVEEKEEIVSKYSEELITIIFNLIKDGGNVKIKTKKDYPLWVENDNMIILLAPRVEEKYEKGEEEK